MGLLDGFMGLSAPDNKVEDSDRSDSLASELLPELELSMTDDELIALKQQWMKAWEPYEGKIKQIQDENEQYWLGNQFGKSEGAIDNLIFESLETFLPIATRPKAEPLVEGDNTEAGNEIADRVRKMLAYLADTLSFNLKMKQVTRYWALYMLGAMKVGWSAQENDVTCVSIRPQKLILEPTATVDECEYDGYYIGEKVEDMASDLVLRFPRKAQFIKDKVHDKMGTKLEYILWTTDDYMFWTLDNEVLHKIKNPHWNYDTEEEEMVTDEYGEQTVVKKPVEGRNHFNRPKKPYIFLSVFSLGKRPHDETNLIHQNKQLQDLVNKRLKQIDQNADNANNGIALSGDSFTEEQAMNAAQKRRKGSAFWVPTGSVDDAIKDLPAQQLPTFIYESLNDYRNELRNVFGTRGSSPQGTIKEQTLGGKQIIKSQDTDRIGGGVSVYLEEFADRFFNWMVQLMYVYYDEPHFASVLGSERAKEYISLSSQDLNTKLLIGVKEGSMIPHDPENQRMEAVALWEANALDPITFFDRLEFPNPRETAKQLYLWQADPIALFPDLVEEQQQKLAEEQQMLAEQEAASREQQDADALLGRIDQEEQGQAQHDRELERIQAQALAKQPL